MRWQSPTIRAMASRRVLASVADGVASAFVNRDNDVEGWWAPGLLIGETAPANPAYQLDMLTGETVPRKINPALDELGPAWARYFAWTLARHGVPSTRVASASLIVRFDYEASVPSWRFDGTDQPFVCTVTITDDRGRCHERSALSHCAPLSAFDWSEPPAGRPMRSDGPYDAGRISRRVEGSAKPETKGDIRER